MKYIIVPVPYIGLSVAVRTVEVVQQCIPALLQHQRYITDIAHWVSHIFGYRHEGGQPVVLAMGGSPRVAARNAVRGGAISRLYQETTTSSFIYFYSW
jgi:hypothetical protein